MKAIIFVALKKADGEYGTKSLVNLEKITGIFDGKTETAADPRFDKDGPEFICIYQEATDFSRASYETAMEFIERVKASIMFEQPEKHGVYVIDFTIPM